MADELVKIYDENNVYSGKDLMKSVAHRDGLWHRVVHVCIYNFDGKILLQKRASCKELLPNMWDLSVAGHIEASESCEDAVIKECYEEIGIDVLKSDLDLFKVYKSYSKGGKFCNNEFFYFYFLKLDLDLDELVLQEDEVSEVGWFEVSDILDGKIDDLVQHIYWGDVCEFVENQFK